MEPNGTRDLPAIQAVTAIGIGEVSITFRLSAVSEVRLRVFDATGRLVKGMSSGTLPAGEHNLKWNGISDAGKPAGQGVYFYSLDAGKANFAGRWILLR